MRYSSLWKNACDTHLAESLFQTGAGNSVITMNRQMGADIA